MHFWPGLLSQDLNLPVVPQGWPTSDGKQHSLCSRLCGEQSFATAHGGKMATEFLETCGDSMRGKQKIFIFSDDAQIAQP